MPDIIYLYCVTDKNPQFNETIMSLRENEGAKASPTLGRGDFSRPFSGENVHEVYFVYHQGLYAVVNKVSEEEFSNGNLEKNLNDMEWLKIWVYRHEKTIEEIMKGNCVIPFKFATLFTTEDNLKTCLEEHAKEFRENLNYLNGTEEWGVKIYCNLNRFSHFVAKENEEALALENEIAFSSPGKAFFLRKKRKELIQRWIEKVAGIYIEESLHDLIPQSLRMRINKLLPKEVTGKEHEMILNAAFLVGKENVDPFLDAVQRNREKYKEKGLEVDCTGPWPPYNFCNLYKEKQGFEVEFSDEPS